jgi:hypothetical protein
MTRNKFGERAACKYCGQDIEFVKHRDWRDRGGNRECPPSINRKTREVVHHKTKHAPTPIRLSVKL